MEEQKKNEQEEVEEKKIEDEGQPFCTTAPSAEHARGDLDDDPCDDFRGGE
jgi:hypothetical protein